MNKVLMNIAVGVSALVMSGMAVAGSFTGNVGATNNYVWRGTTQTDNGAAISGGLDYGSDVGIYVGTWVGNTVFGDKPAGEAEVVDGTGTPTGDLVPLVVPSQELDLYAGYSKEFGDIGVDVGVISYTYPQADNLDFVEYYVGFSYKMFSVQFNTSDDVFATDTDGDYIEAAADFDVGNDMTLGVHVGSYEFDASPDSDYTDYSISLSKGEFTFAVTDTDADDVDWPLDSDVKATVTWTKEFEL